MRISGDGKITWENASASSKYLLEMRVAGDSYPRFRIRADGQIEWGGGTSTPSMKLLQAGIGTLKLTSSGDSTIVLDASSGEEAIIRFGYGGSINYWSIATNWKAYGDYAFRIWSHDGTSWKQRLVIGKTSGDVQIKSRLEVGTLGVGNSAAATTPGNVVKKIEVFDDAGNSLGFLAVYDSIT